MFAVLAALAVVAATCAAPPPPPPDPAPGWERWVTSPDKQHLLDPMVGSSDAPTSSAFVDTTVRGSTWRGAGGALTDSSVELIELAGRDLLNGLFGPASDRGARLNLVRLPLSATDFSTRLWTWQDSQGSTAVATPEAERAINTLNEAHTLNPSLAVVASPWSAPAWMKDSGSLTGGGLAVGQEGAYGNLLLAQVEALQQERVPLAALTVVNEPGHSSGEYPTMTMTDDQLVAVGSQIRPVLTDRGIELWALDHNWADRPRVDSILGQSPGTFDAVAFHCYAGRPSAMAGLPVPALITECSGGEWDPSWDSTFRWQTRNLVTDALRHGSTGLMVWNLALDPSGGPHTGGCADCRGVVTVDPSSGQWTAGPEFYLLAHISRAADPGAVNLGTTGRPDIPTVAFENPDGTVGLFGHNDSGAAQVISVEVDGEQSARVSVPAGALFTARSGSVCARDLRARPGRTPHASCR